MPFRHVDLAEDSELDESVSDEEESESDQSATCKPAENDDATIGISAGEVSIGNDSVGSSIDSKFLRAVLITVKLVDFLSIVGVAGWMTCTTGAGTTGATGATGATNEHGCIHFIEVCPNCLWNQQIRLLPVWGSSGCGGWRGGTEFEDERFVRAVGDDWILFDDDRLVFDDDGPATAVDVDRLAIAFIDRERKVLLCSAIRLLEGMA